MKQTCCILLFSFVLALGAPAQQKTDTIYYKKNIECLYLPAYQIIDSMAKEYHFNTVYVSKRPEHMAALLCDKDATIYEKLELFKSNEFIYQIRGDKLMIYEHHDYYINPSSCSDRAYINVSIDPNTGVEVLRFQNISFATLVENVGKYFHVTIKNKLSKMPAETVTGFFPESFNPWILISDICMRHKLHFISDKNEVFTLKNINGPIEKYWDLNIVQDSPFVKLYFNTTNNRQEVDFKQTSPYTMLRIMAELSNYRLIFNTPKKPLEAINVCMHMTGNREDLLNFFCKEYKYCYKKNGDDYMIDDCIK